MELRYSIGSNVNAAYKALSNYLSVGHNIGAPLGISIWVGIRDGVTNVVKNALGMTVIDGPLDGIALGPTAGRSLRTSVTINLLDGIFDGPKLGIRILVGHVLGIKEGYRLSVAPGVGSKVIAMDRTNVVAPKGPDH